VSASLRSAYGLAASVAYTFLDTEILAVDGLPEEAPPPSSREIRSSAGRGIRRRSTSP